MTSLGFTVFSASIFVFSVEVSAFLSLQLLKTNKELINNTLDTYGIVFFILMVGFNVVR